MEMQKAVQHPQINVNIQHDIFHTVFYKKIFPAAQPEPVVEHDQFLRIHDSSKLFVGIFIKCPEKTHGHMAAADRFSLIERLLPTRRKQIDTKADGLVKHFDAKQPFPMPVTLPQPF